MQSPINFGIIIMKSQNLSKILVALNFRLHTVCRWTTKLLYIFISTVMLLSNRLLEHINSQPIIISTFCFAYLVVQALDSAFPCCSSLHFSLFIHLLILLCAFDLGTIQWPLLHLPKNHFKMTLIHVIVLTIRLWPIWLCFLPWWKQRWSWHGWIVIMIMLGLNLLQSLGKLVSWSLEWARWTSSDTWCQMNLLKSY